MLLVIIVVVTMSMIRTYSELIKIPDYSGRLAYLREVKPIGRPTFGPHRNLNQDFYHSDEWKSIRRSVILRDGGCDLGLVDYPIFDRVIVHHMNAITMDDLLNRTDFLLNPEFLICVSHDTHEAIEFGGESRLTRELPVRTKNDTILWRSIDS